MYSFNWLGPYYRGKCPPESPPLGMTTSAVADDDVSDAEEDSGSALVGSRTIETHIAADGGGVGGARTLPRYYYYSENDDYGVTKQQQKPEADSRTIQRSFFNDRRTAQRHLGRSTRTRPAPVQGV